MAEKLERSLNSVMKQTYRNLEVILVDDGSTDNTLDVCKSMAKKDNRIKVIHTSNKGSGEARNIGIDNANGSFIYFPDADDELCKYAIEELVKCVKDYECDFLVFGHKEIDSRFNHVNVKKYKRTILSGDEVRDRYERHLNRGDLAIQGAPWNKFFSLRKIKDNGIRYPNLRRHQDDIFIMRYMDIADKVVFLESVLYKHYVSDLNSIWEKFPENYFDIVRDVYKYRLGTILSWNPENCMIKQKLDEAFVVSAITALELTYSSAYALTIRQRYKWYRKMVADEEFILALSDAQLEEYLYQRIIAKLLRRRKYLITYLVLGVKVASQLKIAKPMALLKQYVRE